jgi:hypothetical protein
MNVCDASIFYDLNQGWFHILYKSKKFSLIDLGIDLRYLEKGIVGFHSINKEWIEAIDHARISGFPKKNLTKIFRTFLINIVILSQWIILILSRVSA